MKSSMFMDPHNSYLHPGGHTDLVKLTVHKIYQNPSLAREVTKLYAGSYEHCDTKSVESVPVVDR